MRLCAALLALAACLAPLAASSQDAERCVMDIRGNQVCGVRACLRDARSGDISCASAAGGATITDPSGATTCEGGCVPASRSACRRMTPN
jgi:hypothetical protein